jgi:asparagine N-glycosylation enzyme membrane subunit Stt3
MFVESKENDSSHDQGRVDAVVARGPGGAFAVAGLAVGLVMAMWFAFYIFVFLARGGD